jgi:hypothetical protein
MSIGFESEEVQRKKLRERLQAMSDEELIRYGRALRRVKAHRVSGVPDRVDELAEARRSGVGGILAHNVRLAFSASGVRACPQPVNT